MKIKNILSSVILGILGIILVISIYNYIFPSKTQINNTEFIQKTDSLNKVIDLLNKDINKSDSSIEQLHKRDSLLSNEVERYKSERDIARDKYKKLADKFKTISDDNLVKFYVERYAPESPLTLAIPREALVLAAHEITLCDGTEQELLLADSTIHVLNTKLFIKDSIIFEHEIQKSKYQDIVDNQDSKYLLLKEESEKQNKKLKRKVTFWKTTTGLVALGSILLIL